MKKEIERRFVLKNIPIPIGGISISEIQNINQYYYLVDNIWHRIRKIESSITEDKYLHTIKTYENGITFEEEKYLNFSDFKELITEINNGKYKTRFLYKTRYIIPTKTQADFDGKNEIIKWEIDVFNFNLIIAEVEIPEMSFDLLIPSFLQKQIIYEVTGISEFSNRNLAEPLFNSKL